MFYKKQKKPQQGTFIQYRERTMKEALQMIHTSVLNLECAKNKLCMVNGSLSFQEEISKIEAARREIEDLLLSLQNLDNNKNTIQ